MIARFHALRVGEAGGGLKSLTIVAFQTAKLRRAVQMLRATRSSTDARLSRFYNKFCLQGDRSTSYAKRC